MNLSNKRIIAGLLLLAGFGALVGFVLPALLSAPSTLMVLAAFGIVFAMIAGGVILVRNALGLKPNGSDSK